MLAFKYLHKKLMVLFANCVILWSPINFSLSSELPVKPVFAGSF